MPGNFWATSRRRHVKPSSDTNLTAGSLRDRGEYGLVPQRAVISCALSRYKTMFFQRE